MQRAVGNLPYAENNAGDDDQPVDRAVVDANGLGCDNFAIRRAHELADT